MTDVFDVAVLGSANLDLVVRAPRHPTSGETLLGSDYTEFPGGKGLNQAVAARRSGAHTAFVGALGDDDAGSRLGDLARTEGIDVARVEILTGTATGRALITVADDGDNTIVVVPGANARVRSSVPECTVLVAQLEIPLVVVQQAFHAARQRGARTVLNPAPAAPLPPELLADTDIIVPNAHEVTLLGGADALLDAGVAVVVTTLGAEGAEVLRREPSGGTARHRYAPPHVRPVDTTGAGDSFCGSLAARLAAGDDIDAAVRWAVAAGALATTVRGAVPSIPHAEAIAGVVTP